MMRNKARMSAGQTGTRPTCDRESSAGEAEAQATGCRPRTRRV